MRNSFLIPLFGLLAVSNLFAFEFDECQVKKNALSIDAECAVLERPENPAEPQGKKVQIHVTRFPARTPEPAADAFTVIQGGPGMSSIDLFLSMRGIFAGVQSKRDVLVFDQRGTGRSNMLTCEQDEDSDLIALQPEEIKRQAQTCLDQLASNPAFYTTSVAVQDMEAIRAAAGYEQLSIYGVSYGTRVAQHYARRYPQKTRLLILDGVADVGLNLAGGEIAVRSQQAFDRMVQRCDENQACKDQFGNLADKFNALRKRLQESPAEVSFLHPVSGQPVTEMLTEQHLLGMVRLMPYSTESLALLPFILAQAFDANYVPMAAQSVLAEQQFSNDYAYAMNNSVVCTEDAPFVTAADLEGQAQTYFGSMMADSMQALCEVWPKGPMDEEFRESFTSDIPALLLSGETDPITPPENGSKAAAMFTNSKHIVVPAHGHGVIGRGCLPQLAGDFIELASVDELEEACVFRERALPFFITPAGPTP